MFLSSIFLSERRPSHKSAPVPLGRFFGRMSRFRRSAAAGADILLAKPRYSSGVGSARSARPFGSRLIEEPLQERPAPAAAGPRAKTLAQLSHAADLFHPDEIHHFPLGDSETKADFVVKIHGYPTPGSGQSGTPCETAPDPIVRPSCGRWPYRRPGLPWGSHGQPSSWRRVPRC